MLFNLLTRKIEFAVYMEMLKDASNISEVKKEVEKISKNAVVWSHMRSVEVSLRKAEQGIMDSWFVCNKSCDHPATPIGQGRCHRVNLALCSFCQTVVRKGGSKKNRADLRCRFVVKKLEMYENIYPQDNLLPRGEPTWVDPRHRAQSCV